MTSLTKQQDGSLLKIQPSTSQRHSQETFSLKLNGMFNPKVDSFSDLKIIRRHNQQQHKNGANNRCANAAKHYSRRSTRRHPSNDDIYAPNVLVSPMDTQSGVKKYTCQKCYLTFDMIDGPYGVNEHVRQEHA